MLLKTKGRSLALRNALLKGNCLFLGVRFRKERAGLQCSVTRLETVDNRRNYGRPHLQPVTNRRPWRSAPLGLRPQWIPSFEGMTSPVWLPKGSRESAAGRTRLIVGSLLCKLRGVKKRTLELGEVGNEIRKKSVGASG